MRIKDLFENKEMKFNDFIENNEINYDLAEDLVFFMNHDDHTYRKHTYPAIIKCLEGLRKKKKVNRHLFKNAALESYKNYCSQFPINELPSALDEQLLDEVCKLIHEEVCTHESEGLYKECISEGKNKPIRKTMKSSGVYAKRYDNIDTYYDMYRFGIALATDENCPNEGPIRDNPSVWMYTPAEEEKVSKAERQLGMKGANVVPKGPSEEVPSINNKSPVAKIKKNKYGV